MAKYILKAPLMFRGATLKAGKVVDSDVYDIAALQLAGAKLVSASDTDAQAVAAELQKLYDKGDATDAFVVLDTPTFNQGGGVQVAKDIGGTSALPTVVAITGDPITKTLPASIEKTRVAVGTAYEVDGGVIGTQVVGAGSHEIARITIPDANIQLSVPITFVVREHNTGFGGEIAAKAIVKKSSAGALQIQSFIANALVGDAEASAWTVTAAASGSDLVLSGTGPTGSALWSTIYQPQGARSAVNPSLPAPTLASATPNTGDIAGGTSVNLVGTGFVSGAGFKAIFDVTDAASTAYTSPTAATAVTPPHAAAVTTVKVQNPDGQFSNTVPFTFTSGPPPWNLPAAFFAFYDPDDPTKLQLQTGPDHVLRAINIVTPGTYDLLPPGSVNEPGYGGIYMINGHHLFGQRGNSSMTAAGTPALNDFTIAAGVVPRDETGDNTAVSLGAFIPELTIYTGKAALFLGAYYVGTVSIPLNAPSTVIVTRAGTTGTIYVNGVQDGPTFVVSGALTGTAINILIDGGITYAKLDLGPCGVANAAITTLQVSDLHTQMMLRLQ